MITRISATEVRVEWEPLLIDIGTGPSYVIRYRVVESERVKRNVEDTASYVEVFQSGAVIDDLEPHLLYGISVAAKNDMGVGDYSSETVAECEFTLLANLTVIMYLNCTCAISYS